MKIKMQAISSIRRDFLASHLRFQIQQLRNVLESIEEDEDAGFGYADESLKQIETALRNIRKSCLGND
ncbi:MAG: hypothetical protein V1869_06065 [Candidatus Omnitrophota bacterium]